MADSVSAWEIFAELQRICAQPCGCHADFFILHGTLSDAKNPLENIGVMARPKRFELLTPDRTTDIDPANCR